MALQTSRVNEVAVPSASPRPACRVRNFGKPWKAMESYGKLWKAGNISWWNMKTEMPQVLWGTGENNRHPAFEDPSGKDANASSRFSEVTASLDEFNSRSSKALELKHAHVHE